ncbi:MAG TPA: TIGR01777 family oxidoreductase [Ilumatobacter sp.]
MRIGITGSSGLIGTALSQHLAAAGHTVAPIVRRAARPGTSEISWDPAAGSIDRAAVAELDAIVHLAGAGIGDHRWTAAYKQVLLDSRVAGTTLLSTTLAELGADGPQVLLSGSAIGFYGERGDEPLDETSAGGHGFLAEICRQWEHSTAAAEAAGVRVAHLRTGIVLSADGGALAKMLPLFKLALGGRFGKGTQWMSWITIDDEVRAIEHLLTSEAAGAVNLTAPQPVRNAEFAATLAKVLKRPAWLPVPSFGPKLLLGSQLADALLFDGQRVLPRVLEGDGFAFRHADLDTGLRAALGR